MIWTKISSVLPELNTGSQLSLVVDGKTIFSHFQVLNSFTYLYDSFSFRQNELSNSLTAFLAQYTAYQADIGYNFARMYDALTRDYNPIENYHKFESVVDANTKSKTSTTNNSANVTGTIDGVVTNSHNGEDNTLESGGLTNATTNNIENRNYDSTFDGSDFGVATTKSTNNGNDSTTTTYNNLNVKNSYNSSNTVTKGNVSTSNDINGQAVEFTNMSNVGKTTTGGVDVTEYGNNVSASYQDVLPDGITKTSATLGNNFTEANLHTATMCGNIGVTTNAQMITGELEMRRINLLNDYVMGFIRKYCSFLGVDE